MSCCPKIRSRRGFALGPRRRFGLRIGGMLTGKEVTILPDSSLVFTTQLYKIQVLLPLFILFSNFDLYSFNISTTFHIIHISPLGLTKRKPSGML